MILFELVNFEGNYLDEAKEIRGALALASKFGTRWIEWSPVMMGIVDKPDISIVSARNMFPKTLKKIIESRNGTVKIAYGPFLHGLGCICIDKGFSVKELESFFSKEEAAGDQDDGLNGIGYRPDVWMKTIPMPIPLSR